MVCIQIAHTAGNHDRLVIPAHRAPDRLLVGARLLEFQGDRFAMEHLVYSTALKTVAAKGEAVIVPYDYETKSKVPIPDAWRLAIERVESGGR